jgi:hypothetical protein
MRKLAILTTILLFASVPIAVAQVGNAPFCLQTPSGAKCIYTTMGDCERARGDTSAVQCITQTDARGVTGLGKPLVPSPAAPSSEQR